MPIVFVGGVASGSGPDPQMENLVVQLRDELDMIRLVETVRGVFGDKAPRTGYIVRAQALDLATAHDVAKLWVEFQISNMGGWNTDHLLMLRDQLNKWLNGEVLPRLTQFDPLLPDNLKAQIRVLFQNSVGVGYDHNGEPHPWGDLKSEQP